MKALEDFLKPTQKELFAALSSMYKGHTVIDRKSVV